MANWVEQLDAQIAAVLYDWTILTTILALLVLAFILQPVIFSEEPDTHPLLLARQSSTSPVRNKNESAVYRSPEVPHGYPLRSGLNVKDANAPRWATGKDGDLRDVWREVQKGGSKSGEGNEIPSGLIMTVLGKQEIVEHQEVELSKEIRIIGLHLKESGVKKVAIYLPNRVEYLLAFFACSFYGLSPILLPYNIPHPRVYELLNSTDAGALICAAGNLPLDDVAKYCPNLRLLTWVVEKTSRHMDWNGLPDSAQGRLNVSVWHDVVEDENQAKATASELPTNENGDPPGEIITIWHNYADLDQKDEIVTFTHANIVAATAALISTLPLRQRFSPADLILPASSFHIPYVLCKTLAALYTHASLAITSVAEPGVDLALATRSVSPTVIIASAETLAALYKRETASSTSLLQKFGKYTQARTMSAGRMPTSGGFLSKFLFAPSSSNAPGKLRLILTSDQLGAGSPPLTSIMLSDLRIFTSARICYALTASKVAGAVAQTNVFDYRREGDDGSGTGTGTRECAHFGVPVSSVEVKLVNGDERRLERSDPEGEIVVAGPAVSGGGGDVKLGVKGRFGEDGTLALI